MKIALTVRNRQRVRKVDVRLYKKILTAALADLEVGAGELCFHLVGEEEMAKVNWNFLQHEGSTDVITFDISENLQSATGNQQPATFLAGEIFICLHDAVEQAKEYGTTWQQELVRYGVHGILHLLGHDDLSAAPRRAMKREENRLVLALSRQFPLKALTS